MKKNLSVDSLIRQLPQQGLRRLRGKILQIFPSVDPQKVGFLRQLQGRASDPERSGY